MSFDIYFSDIRVRFLPPAVPLDLPPELECLLCEEPGPVDAQYELRLLETPLVPCSAPVLSYNGITLYHTPKGQLRIYSLRGSEDGCQVACLLCPDGNHILYYPAALWDDYAHPLHCAHLLGLETVLLKRNAFLLHSSVVLLRGKVILFCGPSGAGKSTQADLWQHHLGAEILNGDRCVVMQKGTHFYGGGGPLAGHSGIYRPEQAPIAAIFLTEQAPDNQVTRMGFSALAPLLGQTLINSWDEHFMHRLSDLYQQLLAQVPVYRLRCRVDKEAVQLACQIAFPEGGV